VIILKFPSNLHGNNSDRHSSPQKRSPFPHIKQRSPLTTHKTRSPISPSNSDRTLNTQNPIAYFSQHQTAIAPHPQKNDRLFPYQTAIILTAKLKLVKTK
jgi:hypothetical protein